MRSVSLVVPVKDASRTLPRCLQALGRLDPPPLEILLVDNGSRDTSRELLERFARDHHDVRVLEEPRPGAAAARNRGIATARGQVVAFTDADCVPERDWLGRLVVPVGDGSTAAAAGRVTAATPDSLLELFSTLYTLRLPPERRQERQWTPWSGGYPTANLAVERDLLESLDGFDETLTVTGEDFDLCARIYGQGATIAYVPEARVAHLHRARLGPMLRQAYGFGQGHPALFRRHGQGLWIDLPGKSISWPDAPVHGWIDLAGADKKLLGTAIPAAIWPTLWPLPLLYLGWLVLGCSRRIQDDGAGSPAAAPLIAALLLLKSAALSAGRLRGSLRQGAVCV